MRVSNYYKSFGTDKGPRQLNEDSYLILPCKKDNNLGFFILVADGLGGLERGEVASGYIKQSLKAWYTKEKERLFSLTNDEIKDLLNQEISNIHNLLKISSEEEGTSYGSTLTCMLIINTSYIIAHVGDSRAYIYYRGGIHPLTKDQTQYQMLLDQEEELEGFTSKEILKMQSTLLQCIGHGTCYPRFYEGLLPDEYEILLCTDGFYRKLDIDDFKEFFTSEKSGDEKIKQYIDSVLERGEKDNITAVTLKKIYEEV